MTKYKSLGSSPIGFQSSDSSLSFIRDLGVSKKEGSKEDTAVSESAGRTSRAYSKSERNDSEDKTKKKIVSYYLEERLISDLKEAAEEHGMYYSALVSQAIREWLERNIQPHHHNSIRRRINNRSFILE